MNCIVQSLYRQWSTTSEYTEDFQYFILHIFSFIIFLSTIVRSLPDIDTLLQEWNPEVEEVLGEESAVLPPNLDCDLSSYIDIACGMKGNFMVIMLIKTLKH